MSKLYQSVSSYSNNYQNFLQVWLSNKLKFMAILEFLAKI